MQIDVTSMGLHASGPLPPADEPYGLARASPGPVYMSDPRCGVLIKQLEAFVEVVRRGTVSRAAEALGVTARTVRRDWVKARGLLQAELSG